jgi:hypothetical protein
MIMKRETFIILLMSIALFAAICAPANCGVYNTLYSHAAVIAAETPKVILQQGTAGISTIYMNNTSAKVKVTAPLGVAYGYAFKSSNIRVSTASGTPVDDPQAVLNITLEVEAPIFIIYNAGNKGGSIENYDGKGCAINVDGVDVAFSWQSPYGNNYANSVTVVYATTLAAGSHVIKGRFFANNPGYTVGIDVRQIAAFWFPGIFANYVRSTTKATTTSSTPVDDPQATLTFTLNQDSLAFIVYNVGNERGSTEPATGKGITINIDGVDIATRQWQSPYSRNKANSVTLAYATTLSAGSHTVKGRFFSNTAGSTTTIDERQLIVFCFPTGLTTYGFAQSTTAVSTTSGTPVDDTQAVLSLSLARDSIVLIMYVGGNPNSATEDYDGKGVQLQIDGQDQSDSVSWQSPYGSNYANSATALWCGQLTEGSHTIKGRFFANYAGYTVTISHRQLVALAFPKPANYNYVLKTVNQVTDAWKIRLRVCGYSNIGRLSNCTIYFYNGGGVSRQISIHSGTCVQQFGNWYDLAGSSTVYIAMTVSADSTGASYVYSYLEVLIPNTTTYNLMIITFEIS